MNGTNSASGVSMYDVWNSKRPSEYCDCSKTYVLFILNQTVINSFSLQTPQTGIRFRFRHLAVLLLIVLVLVQIASSANTKSKYKNVNDCFADMYSIKTCCPK